jgi:hypothetical protein
MNHWLRPIKVPNAVPPTTKDIGKKSQDGMAGKKATR